MVANAPDAPNLSVRQLRAFQAVARYSSFVAASVEMRMSQPGISRLIRAAETELGIELFRRSTRQVVLTPAGQQLLPVVDRILAEFDLAAAALPRLREGEQGHVIIACPVSIANRMLADIVRDFRHLHPNVSIEIREALRGDVVNQIRFGVADFGLASFMEPDDDLIIDQLCDVSYRVVFRPDHPFHERASVSLAELRDQPMISLPPSSILRRIFDGAAAREGFGLSHVVTVNTPSTIFNLVENGVGVTIQNDVSIGSYQNERLASRPIYPPKITSRIAVVRLKNRPMSPVARALLKVVERFFRNWPAI